MSTSTSTSSKTPPVLSRIKLGPAANSAPRTYTGKHLPPGQQRSVGSGTKTRPPALPSPTPNSNAGGGNGGGGANGAMSNANTGPGTRISERRRTAHKPGEFASLAKGKGRGSSVDDKGKGTGVEEEGESIIVRGAPAKVGLRISGKKPLPVVTVRSRRGGWRAIVIERGVKGDRTSANVEYAAFIESETPTKTFCQYDFRYSREIPRPDTERHNTSTSTALSF